jgi:photosystem II stability/assembly factor-like uncharacterized protein
MSVCLSPCGAMNYKEQSAPRRLLAGTVDGVRILERSGAGTPWRETGAAMRGEHVSSLARSTQGGIVVAGFHSGGLAVSEDDGATWQHRQAGLRHEHVFTVGCVVQAGRLVLYAGTLPVTLCRSFDLGRSWEELPSIATMPGHEKWYFPGVPATPHLKVLCFDPRDPMVVLAGVEQGGVFRSADGGATWSELVGYSRPDDPYHQDIHEVVLEPSNPDAFYLTTGIGIYHSPDRGRTWRRLTDPDFRIGYPDHLVISPLDERVVFVAGARVEPSNFRRDHYADGTVLRSRDSGATWERCGTGLPDTTRANMSAMSIGSYPGGFSLFVGDTDGYIYCSDDGGDTWVRSQERFAPVSKVLQYTQLREPQSA